jgi:hypothetical protein
MLSLVVSRTFQFKMAFVWQFEDSEKTFEDFPPTAKGDPEGLIKFPLEKARHYGMFENAGKTGAN